MAWLLASFACLLTLGLLALPAPAQLAESAGPVLPLDGGQIYGLTVSVNSNLFEALRSRSPSWMSAPLTSARSALHDDPSQVDPEVRVAELTAWSLAHTITGHPVRDVVLLTSPADPLLPADLVVSVDGQPADSPAQVAFLLGSRGPHTVEVVRGQSTLALPLRQQSVDESYTLLGSDASSFLLPVGVRPPPSDTQFTGVAGPSAGLALTLAAVDGLTPGSLTPFPVAATGEVTPSGRVLSVSGVEWKTEAAAGTDAMALFVPADQGQQAYSFPGWVVPVGHVDDAIAWLCSQGADDTVCSQDRYMPIHWSVPAVPPSIP